MLLIFVITVPETVVAKLMYIEGIKEKKKKKEWQESTRSII